MYNREVQRKLVLLAGAGAVLAAVLWLWRLCDQAGPISFLAHRGPAEWLVYPKPTVPHLQAVVELPTSFRRAFVLSHVPAAAPLSVRACRRCLLVINGRSVPLSSLGEHWKQAQQFDAAQYLRPGENSISVTVYNQLGPPALWLRLEGDGLKLVTDSSWEASYAGAVWRPAQLAERPPPAAPGNPLRGGETSGAAFRKHWPWAGAALLFGAAVVVLGRWWFRSSVVRALPGRWQWMANPAVALLALIAVLWIVLFTHNLSFVPRGAGFDSEGHLAYISYIQEHGALPLANDGWEMHQPPLYYLLSATVLNALKLSAGTFDGLAALRLMALAIGLTQLALIFCTLRLLFPAAMGKQVVGLTLAGFLPMQLYVTHYVTNETLAAGLMSAVLYFSLRLVQAEENSWRCSLALGLCLGLALLTKVTALVLVPFVLAALLYRLVRPGFSPASPSEESSGQQQARGSQAPPGVISASAALSDMREPASQVPNRRRCWLSPVVAVVACLAVCGWHYWRVWQHFGHAFFVPTRWAYGVSWWQDPGYRTAAYFTRFGRSLAAPFFSGVSSFGDGLYSTLWGDGLCGGAAGMLYRPPWNYELMAGGFLLALLPTALILTGLFTSCLRLVRRSEAVWWGLLGFAFAMLLAIVHLNLEVPAYAEAKAIFGLAALIPLCAFAAAGWEFLCLKLGRAGIAAGVVFCAWALTSYASFWVCADVAPTYAAVGRGLMKEGNLAGAIVQFESALQRDPGHIAARSSLITVFLQQNRLPEAAQAASSAVAAHPHEALCHLDLALVLEKQGNLNEALEHTRRAVELAPDHPDARLKLASRLFQLQRQPETIIACREALRLTPADPEVHFLLASALASEAKRPDVSLDASGAEHLGCGPAVSFSPSEVLTGEAINHFEFVVKLAPDTPDALNHLAWILATHPRAELRDGREAVRLAERARVLTENRNPSVLTTLAAAYAETGQYTLAVEKADDAVKLAVAAGNLPLQERSQRFKELFGKQRPFRQDLPGPR